ncbi:hypothetical protein HNQ60_005378 [Povalibacter uvarum]|uniref:Uncharacterized protein n=1 Tax=Povalibacter uvarum TaxID=732238 RepID=A0A841HU67_9GAMM|nr:hypothetical protein [Povalibacter uvarum]MBB6096456.1 hypothetical protein [Povalibacter uvarum]
MRHCTPTRDEVVDQDAIGKCIDAKLFRRTIRSTQPQLLRQIRTNQLRGLNELPGRYLNSLSTLCISAWIVWYALLTPGAIERRELRGSYSPIASLLTGHDMEMEVRCFLPAEDPIVLKREYSERSVSPDERLRDSLRRDQYSPAFLLREIQQRRDMPARDDATLANFELPRVDHGKRMFAFVDDRPPLFATRHPFAKVARISYGKLDQLQSPSTARFANSLNRLGIDRLCPTHLIRVPFRNPGNACLASKSFQFASRKINGLRVCGGHGPKHCDRDIDTSEIVMCGGIGGAGVGACREHALSTNVAIAIVQNKRCIARSNA